MASPFLCQWLCTTYTWISQAIRWDLCPDVGSNMSVGASEIPNLVQLLTDTEVAEILMQKTLKNSPSRLNGSRLCPALVPGLFDPSREDCVNSLDDMMEGDKVQTL